MKKIVLFMVLLTILIMLPTNDTEIIKASVGGGNITAAVVGIVIAILMRETKTK